MKIKIVDRFLTLSFKNEVETKPIVESPKDKKIGLCIILFSSLISICTWSYYFANKMSLSYNDARSHLNISRRVFDSLQPGLSQLGSVWLPFPHVLQLLTIWNDFMYRTGLSGSLISMISYVACAYLVYRTARQFNLKQSSSVICSLVMVANQNYLFLQSTPMTESLLLFSFCGAIYFFARWANTARLHNLLVSSFFTFAAMLTRYDGWFLFIALTACTYVITLLKYDTKRADAFTIIYSVVGIFALGLWLLWNKMIFGSWLFFLNSEYSAKAQQEVLYREGRLLTKHNMLFSIDTFTQSMIFNIGLLICILGTIGILAYLFSRNSISRKICLIALASPVIFNVLSLYLGHSTINLPTLPPYNWFNVRYGLMALPIISLGVGYLANRRVAASFIVGAIVLASSYHTYSTKSIITVQDGVRGSSGFFLDDVGGWIHKNATEGKILVAASSHDALIFVSGLPLRRYVTEGIYRYWKVSLKTPQKYVTYVIMGQGDSVWRNLHDNPNFTQNYKLVYEGKHSNVYKLE